MKYEEATVDALCSTLRAIEAEEAAKKKTNEAHKKRLDKLHAEVHVLRRRLEDPNNNLFSEPKEEALIPPPDTKDPEPEEEEAEVEPEGQDGPF